MSPLERISELHLIGVSLGAGFGAVGRSFVDRAIVARFGATRLPYATLLVNVAGSLLVGIVVAWALSPGRADADRAETVALVLGTGLCGGLTTFSSFSVETFTIIREGRGRAGLLYAGLTMGLGMAAVWTGTVLGTALG